MSKISKSFPNLKQFILKQEVKKLYRNIFRTIRKVPDEFYQKELKDWTRRDFRSNAHYEDEVAIKMCIKYGERCLRELDTSLNLAK
ncbi:hypothetical protein JTB14_021476 [Gonioctena quinquepunctata]|nr:hypothetical protein JTB14_021476 [Gonioctena quinquepunctata]